MFLKVWRPAWELKIETERLKDEIAKNLSDGDFMSEEDINHLQVEYIEKPTIEIPEPPFE